LTASSIPDLGRELERDLIELCRELIRTPSVNGRDPEKDVAEIVARFAIEHDLTAELLGAEAARPNAIVHCGPPADRVGLLLVAHTDTVPVNDPTAWTSPPFGAELVGERIYGRGAIDNKGGLVAALGAMAMIRGLGPGSCPSPPMLIAVPDEESGATGTLGVHYLKKAGRLAGRGAIYTYPGMDFIEIGHRGVLRLSLRARGKAFHSGSRDWQEASVGHNALTGLAEILLRLERLRFPDPTASDLFADFRTVVTPTTIGGGSGPSIVPPECSATVDIRLVPQVPRTTVEQAVRRVVAEATEQRPGLSVEMRTEIFIPNTEIPRDADIVRALQSAAETTLGRKPGLAVSGPANESYILNGYGIPTCVFGPVGENAHAADEYVVTRSIFQAAQIYASTALQLGGGA
jgi:succinyl-diaminopimelate desuccinylase